LKIALALQSARAARGGQERYSLMLADRLIERGCDVSILAAEFDDTPTRWNKVRVCQPAHGHGRRYRVFADALDRHLRSYRYDAVHAMIPVRHCEVYHPHSGLAAEQDRRGYLKHASWPMRRIAQVGNQFNTKRRLLHRLERGLIERSHPATVLCLSNIHADLIRQHYPKLNQRFVAVLPNGVDTSHFCPAPDREMLRKKFGYAQNDVIGLFIAHHWKFKGAREAIAALAKVGAPNLKLVLVGGEPPEPYRRFAESLGVANQVIFAGSVPDALAHYQAADFFVLPTRGDSCSLSLLEATAAGLPVISTSKNGACELIENDREGFVIEDPQDVEALGTAMKKMLSSGLRAKMSKACLELAPKLSWDSHVDRLMEIYRGIAAA
jgi:UDP-glucose:(heptosyl)LPS alpha-1,3-glucosyltransferase